MKLKGHNPSPQLDLYFTSMPQDAVKISCFPCGKISNICHGEIDKYFNSDRGRSGKI